MHSWYSNLGKLLSYSRMYLLHWFIKVYSLLTHQYLTYNIWNFNKSYRSSTDLPKKYFKCFNLLIKIVNHNSIYNLLIQQRNIQQPLRGALSRLFQPQVGFHHGSPTIGPNACWSAHWSVITTNNNKIRAIYIQTGPLDLKAASGNL